MEHSALIGGTRQAVRRYDGDDLNVCVSSEPCVKRFGSEGVI